MSEIVPQNRIIPEIEESKRVKKKYLIYTGISIGIIIIGRFVPKLRESFDHHRELGIKERQEQLIILGPNDKGDLSHFFEIEDKLELQVKSQQSIEIKSEILKLQSEIEKDFSQKINKSNVINSRLDFLIQNAYNIFIPISPFQHALEEDHSQDHLIHLKNRYLENRLPEKYLKLLDTDVLKLQHFQEKIELLEKNTAKSFEAKQEVFTLKKQLEEAYLSDKYNRLNKILPLIVKDGYEPDDLEGNFNKILDFILKSVEFITESTFNLLKDELILEVILFI